MTGLALLTKLPLVGVFFFMAGPTTSFQFFFVEMTSVTSRTFGRTMFSPKGKLCITIVMKKDELPT